MATEAEVEQFIKEQKLRQRLEGCFGPSRFADLEVWEVWTFDSADNEYKTHFVTVDGAGVKTYFNDFTQYNACASDCFARQRDELRAMKETHHEKRVRLYVAAGVFVASAGVLLYLIVKGVEPNVTSFGVLASLIASGGYMFFGAWNSQMVNTTT